MQEQGIVLPDWLKRQANINANTIAITAEEGSLTYSELYCRATNLAAKLLESGLKQGSRIGVIVKSGFLFTQTVHALIEAGLILIPLNWRLSPSELAFQLKDSAATAVLFDTSFSEVGKELQSLIQNMTFFNVEELLLSADKSQNQSFRDSICLDDVHSILYTSGTTGHPKGAQITYGNHLFNTIGVGTMFGLRSGEKWLVPMPLFHVGGLTVLMRSVIYGMSVVIHSSFNESRVNETIVTDGISIVSLVPTMLARMVKLRNGEGYPPTLRVLFLGGSATPKPLMEQAIELGAPIYQSYGLTEADSTVCILHTSDCIERMGSSGKPLLPTEVAIFKDDKIVHEPNVAGEILIKGPTVIKGYLNHENALNHSFIDGWFRTGDIGRLDEEGYLYVLDRRPDMIISGGENIYPTEVESVLLAYEKVDEAGVVGMDHAEWGQVPVAFIKPIGDMTVTSEELIAFCKTRLAKYKIPTQFFMVDSLPRNASGKLLRKSLRECLTR